MTWIVGRAFPFGCAAAVSDIRVTHKNGLIKDCLQKVHHVGPFMALGFAGSALIGLRMVEKLQSLLGEAQPDEAWAPEVVAQWWPEEAREVFEENARLIDDPICELMLLSAHPTQDTGDPNWPRCFVHRFRHPNFVPELADPDGLMPGGSKAVAIGCGNESDRYREVLDHSTDYSGIHGSVMPGDFAARLLSAVRIAVVNHPTPDVSSLLQLCTVSRQYVRIINANGKRYGPGGDVTDFTVPKLATNLVELYRELQGTGDAANARC
jgi:hypothetical protein